jgi:endonuclease YncB( thermonuclease family)
MWKFGRTGFFTLVLSLTAAAPCPAAEPPSLDLAAAGSPNASVPPRPLRPPAAREVLPGPIVAQVLNVIDGDTLVVRARIWVGQDLEIKVRLAGVDAPELRGRCDFERAQARRARDFVRERVAAGRVRLHLIQYGKYAGRVLARVESESGGDLGTALIKAGLARAYGGGKRPGWCG